MALYKYAFHVTPRVRPTNGQPPGLVKANPTRAIDVSNRALAKRAAPPRGPP
jgi:hypothetical protein